MGEAFRGASHTVDEWVHGYQEGDALRGFRCSHCGLITATWGLACPRCGHRALERARARPATCWVVVFTILNVPGRDEILNDAPDAVRCGRGIGRGRPDHPAGCRA